MSVKGLDSLRTLFAQEAEQRLARLGQLVLELERGEPADTAGVIAEVFREVHTLKGSAAVVGFDGVGRYAHVVEEKLGRLRSGSVTPTTAIIDRLLEAIDRLGSMIWESVGGHEVDEIANDAVLTRLDAAFAATLAPDPNGGPDPDIALDVPTMPAARATGGSREASATVMVPIGRLDELVRMVGEAAAAHLRMGRMYSERIGVDVDNLSEVAELSRALNRLQEGVMRTRMVPVSMITDSLQRAVRDAANTLGKDVRWEVRGEDTELDRGVLLQLSDSLLHLVRNAVDHGIETADRRAAAGKPAHATVRLHAMQLGSEVIIAVTDDGGGVDVERVRAEAIRTGIDVAALDDDETLQLIFGSGFSTAKFVTDISGRGVGLDAVRSSVDAARGRVEVRSTFGVGSEFRIIVPTTLAVLRCLLIETAGQRFALPLHRVALATSQATTTLLHAEGRQAIELDGQPVPVFDMAEVLGLPATHTGTGTYVIVNGTVGRRAFLVDQLVGQRDVVIKGLSALVQRLDVIAGTSIEPDGSILLVLDAAGLIERSRRNGTRSVDDVVATGHRHRRSGRLLVVDDALTVRELQRTILERAGFDVTVAIDGIEALTHLENDVFDLVLTDVEMPRMDGFALTERIRAHPSLGNVAVLILTSLASDTDRRRGMEAGADGYIVKSDFDEESLLAAVDRLVGTPVAP